MTRVSWNSVSTAPVGLWTVFAVLTKESAFTLLLIVPAAVTCLYGKTLGSSKRSRRAVLGAALSVLLLLLLYAAGGPLRMREPWLAGARQVWHGVPLLVTFVTGASPVIVSHSGYRDRWSRDVWSAAQQ